VNHPLWPHPKRIETRHICKALGGCFRRFEKAFVTAMVGPNIRDRRNMRRTYLVLLPLTNSYRRRCHAESAGNAEAMVRGHIQGCPAASGSSRRPPEVGRWDRLKRAMTRVDQHSAGAIPRRIRRKRNRPHHRRLYRIPTAERPSLWFKNSLSGPGLGKCCDAPKKEAMRCTAWAFFL
jgi:hypothetical protein